jgi:hypothetical protein
MSYTRLLRDDDVEECLALVAREDGTGGGLPNTASALRGHVAALRSERDEWQRRAESLLKQAEGFEAETAYQKGRDDERAFSAPSGQVAEDVSAAASLLSGAIDGVGDGPRYDRLAAAISLLSTRAQGYEAAIRDRDQWQQAHADMQRLYHGAENRCAEALKERDAAVADSAAWRAHATRVAAPVAVLARAPEVAPEIREELLAAERRFLAMAQQSHPGAALLEQHRQYMETLMGVAEAMGAQCPAALPGEVPGLLRKARNEGLEKMATWASEQEERAKAHPLGDTIHGGALHGASRYNVTMECVRAVRAAVEAMKEPEEV